MALYIEVLKAGHEDESFIYYTYQFSIPDKEYRSASGKKRYQLKIVSGRLKIDKKNGDVHTIELAEGDNGMYAKRASWVLIKHWNQGEFPDKTCWAS